jgi:hypothetical protein
MQTRCCPERWHRVSCQKRRKSLSDALRYISLQKLRDLCRHIIAILATFAMLFFSSTTNFYIFFSCWHIPRENCTKLVMLRPGAIVTIFCSRLGNQWIMLLVFYLCLNGPHVIQWSDNAYVIGGVLKARWPCGSIVVTFLSQYCPFHWSRIQSMNTTVQLAL